MPSLTPNFILRGARLATSTVSLPTSCSGEYADWMPLKTVRVRASPASSVSLQELGRSLDLLAGDDEGDAQVELGEVVDVIVARSLRRRAGAGRSGRRGAERPAARRAAASAGASNRASSCFGSTRCIRCWYGAIRVGTRSTSCPGEVAIAAEQLARDAARQRRQHRREQDREHLERRAARASRRPAARRRAPDPWRAATAARRRTRR